MLTKDRPAMAARALHYFRSQTYDRKLLLIFNAGKNFAELGPLRENESALHWGDDGAVIGTLRNRAIRFTLSAEAPFGEKIPEVFVHWDDDDYSDPRRIEEQVDMLTAPELIGPEDTEAKVPEIVAYHSLPFVDERPGGEVWRYNGYPGYAIGTSLMYWCSTWEKRHFPEIHIGEDTEFCSDRRIVSVDGYGTTIDPPMMIARIHAGSTSMRNMERFRSGADHVFTLIEGSAAAQARELISQEVSSRKTSPVERSSVRRTEF